MNKEVEISKGIPILVEFMEDKFAKIDGANKAALLKTTAAYYEGLIGAEGVRAAILKALDKI